MMGYFDEDKNVREYIKMCEEYDGSELIEILKRHVPEGSTILELGMGPRKDLDILKEIYEVTASDSSQIFVDLYKEKNESVNVVVLDAGTIDTNQKFDCIYTNKVLHHLTRDELKQSLNRQIEVLYESGFLFHTFWFGEKEEKYNDLLFTYYLEDELMNLFADCFEILELERYSEIDTNDSIYLVTQKK